MNNLCAKNRGFTIIELIIVIALVSILGLLSVAFFSRSLLANAVVNTEDEFAGELRKAQLYSMMGKQNGGVWGVAYSANTLYLFKGSSFATRSTAFDETYTVNPNVIVSGLTEVEFSHMTGTPSAQPTIVIKSSNTSRTITINSQGIINK